MLKLLNKAILAGLLFVGFATLSIGTASAADPAQPLRIAIADNYAPFSVIGPDKKPYGLFVDMWKLWSKATGIPIEFQASSWNESVEAVKNGTADIHSGLYRNEQRAAFLDFSDPIHVGRSALYFRSGDAQPIPLEDLGGEKVGVVKGTFQDQFLADNYPSVVRTMFEDNNELINALLRGDVRAVLSETVAVQASLLPRGLQGAFQRGHKTLLTNQVYAGLAKGNTDLLNKINAGFKAIERTKLIEAENRWLTDDFDRFYKAELSDSSHALNSTPQDETSQSVVLNDKEKLWLRQHPISRIAVMTNWPPYDYTDEEGLHYGMHSDLLRLINKHLGTNLVVLPFEAWNEAYTKAASGEVDGILGLSWTKEREKTFLFSSAYYYEPASVLMRVGDTPIKDWNGLNGKTILVPKNTSIIDKMKAELPDAVVVETLSKDDALTRLSKGEGDAYVAWLSASPQRLKDLNLAITAKIDDRQGEVTLGVPVSKPVFASIVQKGINSITQSEWAALREKWVPKAAGVTNLANLTNEETQWIKGHKLITFANEMDWPPFDFVEQDTPKGITVDLVNLIAQKTGINVKFVNGYSWAELLERFNAGDIDVLPALYWTEDRAKTFEFTTPYALNSSVLVVHADHKEFNSFAALKGHKIGIIKGFGTTDLLNQRYPEIELVEVTNALEGLQSVSLGSIDAYFDSIGVISHVLDNNLVPDLILSFDHELKASTDTQLRMATLKSNAVLRNILQKGLDAVSPEEMRTLRNRWLPLNSSENRTVNDRIEFSDEEKAFIAAHPQLKLGVDVAWPPFEFVQDGVHKGISADVVKKVSEISGIELIAQTDLTWAQVLDGAKNGSIDLVPMLQPTSERNKFLDFTKPYVSYPIVIITRDDTHFISSIGAIGSLKTGMVSGYSIETLVKNHYPEINRVPQTDLESMLKNLSSGKIDVALSNLAVATYLMNKLNLVNLRVTAPTEYNNDLAMGVPKGNPVLLSILQKSLDAIIENEMNAIKNSWVALQVEFGLDLKTIMLYALPVFGGFIVIVGIVVVWNRKLGREVDERHEAERHSRMLLEAVGEGIFGVDRKGHVTFVNSVASQALGYEAHELIGQKVHALIHHTRPDGSHFPVEDCPMWEAYTKGRVSRIDNEVLWRKDGTSFPVEYNATPLRRHDNIIGAVISFRDITKVQKATAALHEHLADVEKFNELAVDRELRMIELKQEINALLKEKGAQEKYEIVQ